MSGTAGMGVAAIPAVREDPCTKYVPFWPGSVPIVAATYQYNQCRHLAI